jgi:L-iditol 2-dehydrogenase
MYNHTLVLDRQPRNIAVETNPEHELHIVHPEVPEPGDDECLVHVRATGICGSDVHFWKNGRIGDMVVCGDNGLGHESSGVVIKVGKNVQRFKSGMRTRTPQIVHEAYYLLEWTSGDRVALECGIPCSKPTCYFCRTGRYNACPDVVFFSTPPYHGTLRRYHTHPEAWLHLLPDNMTFEEGSLLEPLSVALAGIDRSGLRLGDPLVICGAGPIGLVSLLAAHASGAAPIVITDLDETRLAVAKKLVPRVRTVLVDRGLDAKSLGAKIVARLGTQSKLVIECTGVEISIHAGIYVSILTIDRGILAYFMTGLYVWWLCVCYWRW